MSFGGKLVLKVFKKRLFSVELSHFVYPYTEYFSLDLLNYTCADFFKKEALT